MERTVNHSFSYTGSASGWLIILNVLSYLGTVVGSGTMDSLSSRFAEFGGAADSVLMVMGEWWRIFTGIFFHFGLPHLFLNCMAIKYLGPRIEKIIGSKLFLFVYLGSGVISTLASSMVHTSVGGGASGAIFGLIGIGGVLEFLLPNEDDYPAEALKGLPIKFRMRLYAKRYSYLTLTLVNVIFAIVVNLLFWIFGVRITIDNTAHLVGLGSGALIFWACVLFMKRRQVLGLGLMTLVLLSFLWGSYTFFQTPYVLNSYVFNAKQEKEPGRSYAFYSQALRIDPNNKEVLYARGKLAFDYGDYRAAFDDFTSLVTLGFPKERFELLLGNVGGNKKSQEEFVLKLILKKYSEKTTI